MAKLTTLDAVRMNRADPDAIVAAGELVDLRFVGSIPVGGRIVR